MALGTMDKHTSFPISTRRSKLQMRSEDSICLGNRLVKCVCSINVPGKEEMSSASNSSAIQSVVVRPIYLC